jgi:hypothetical protein
MFFSLRHIQRLRRIAVGCLDGINVVLGLVDGSFYVSCLHLAAMNCDGAMQSGHFHAQVTHMDCCIELVCKPFAKDGIVRVVKVYYVDGYILGSCIFLTSEGHLQRDFSQCVNFLSSEINQGESEGCSWLLLSFI